MDPIGPGNHERAWNDPPKFAFNSSGTGGSGNVSGRRRLLNKRVPVPIGPQAGNSPLPPPLKPGDGPPIGSSAIGSSTVGPPPLSRPPADKQLPEKTIFSPSGEGAKSTDNKSALDKLQEVEAAFGNSIKRVSEHLKDNVREEISKRFEVMKTMWLDGKLDDVVQNRIVTLTKAIDEENFDDAWSMHQGLIVDFTSMCSPWMIGLKTLIIESRSQRKKECGDTEEHKIKEVEDPVPQVPILSPLEIGKMDINDKKEEQDILSADDDVK